MNHRSSISPTLVTLALLVPTAVSAEQSDTNRLDRFSFDARFGLNLSAKFKRASMSLTAPPRTSPDGNRYNYDDGYVLTDVSGNYGGQTWNWGYDQPGQIAGNTILMHRSTVSADAPSATGIDEDDPQCGFEFAYDRELGKRANCTTVSKRR